MMKILKYTLLLPSFLGFFIFSASLSPRHTRSLWFLFVPRLCRPSLGTYSFLYHPRHLASLSLQKTVCGPKVSTASSKWWFLFFFNLYWSIVVSKCCVSFYFTAKWIRHTYTYIHPFFRFPCHWRPHRAPLTGEFCTPFLTVFYFSEH